MTGGLQLAVNGLENRVAILDGSDQAVVDPDFYGCGVGAFDCDCGVHDFPFVGVTHISSVYRYTHRAQAQTQTFSNYFLGFAKFTIDST